MVYTNKNIKMIVGIDFGTSRSGYAYAFTDDEKIYVKTNWEGQFIPYSKTLTQLLYSPDGKEIVAWGHLVKDKLAEIRKNKDTSNYHHLKEFKMQLYENKNRTEDGPSIISNGCTFRVIDVISDYLSLLKNEALKDIGKAISGNIKDNEILWCLSVPAMWENFEKQLMRRAAQKAGLIGTSQGEAERLLLALEPECAALYCQTKEFLNLEVGTTYMILDSGGGTVDITVNEVVASDESGSYQLRELIKGTGDALGSTYVDKNFIKFLENKLSKEIIKEFFSKENEGDFLKLMSQWEGNKCSLGIGADCVIEIDAKFYSFLKENHPDCLKMLKEEQYGDDTYIDIKQDILEKEIFNPIFNKIVDLVKSVLRQLGSKKCDYICMVGGFSESSLLQERIRNEFQSRVKKIIVPPLPGGAILEGTVIFGLDPTVIRSRISRLTYGCNQTVPFCEGYHNEAKKRWYPDLNRYQCEDVFEPFIISGQSVRVGQKITKIFTPTRKNQTDCIFKLYATSNKEVSYVDEEGVDYLGEIVVQMPDTKGGFERKLELIMEFGNTEISVIARDVTSDNTVQTQIRFSSTYFPEMIGR